MNIKNRIKKADLFGKTISLNFGDDIKTHNTVTGGLISIIFYMIILAFIGYRISVMIQRG